MLFRPFLLTGIDQQGPSGSGMIGMQGEGQQAIGRPRGDTPPVGHFAASPKSIVATTLKTDRAHFATRHLQGSPRS